MNAGFNSPHPYVRRHDAEKRDTIKKIKTLALTTCNHDIDIDRDS